MKSVLSNAALVGSATLASRVTGFGRDIFLAALLGAGPLAEIFVIAFRLPNLFRRLFAEGAFNAAFVPLFTKRLETEGEASALAFAGRILAVLLAALCVFTLLAQIFMPALVLALAQGFSGDAAKFEAAVHYARISFPYLVFMSLVSLFAAMLNATGRFFAAAFAPILLNLVLIGAMALAVAHQGAPLDYIIWGVALAGVLQFAFVFIAAWRARLRVPLVAPKITPEVKSVWVLAVPGISAAGIGQINLLVGTSIATGQAGAAAWLYYADRLYQLPMGVIGVAMSVALLPELARRLAGKQTEAAHEAQSTALLAAPIISLLFERGAFSAQDTAITAQLLQAFCLGLPAFVFIKALQPSFFARQDTRAPFIDGALGVAVNISLSLIFFPIYGSVAIALATVAAGYVTLSLMLVRLARRDVWHLRGRTLARLLAQSLGAALMAGVLVQAMHILPPPAQTLGLWLTGMIGLGGLVFVLAAFLLGGVARQSVYDAVARLRRRQR